MSLTPRLRGERPPDDVLDAIALTGSVLDDDLEGAAAVLRNCDHGPVSVVLAKLLAELLAEQGACPGCFRRWALAAVNRP
jgi:hypothetical protein